VAEKTEPKDELLEAKKEQLKKQIEDYFKGVKDDIFTILDSIPGGLTDIITSSDVGQMIIEELEGDANREVVGNLREAERKIEEESSEKVEKTIHEIIRRVLLMKGISYIDLDFNPLERREIKCIIDDEMSIFED